MSKIKKYEALKDEIVDYIKKHELKKGSKLPKVREIIKSTGYSYATVNRTLLEMEKDGMITKTQGKGIYVNNIDKDSQVSKQVVFIIPKEISKGKIFLNLLNGLRRVFEREEVHLLISISNMSHEKEKLTIERFIEQKVSGLVLFLEDNYRNDYSHIVALKEKKIPFILVDRFIPELDTDYVVVNNMDTMIRICSYLKYKESCEQIIYITHEDTATSEDEKINGFKNAMRTLYSNNPGKVYKIEEFIQSYEEINADNERIGLCFFDNLFVEDLINKLRQSNKTFSSNFRIFGYNNCYEVNDYPSVEQFNDKVGEKAAELLMKRIEKPNIETTHHRIDPKLVFPDGKGGMVT